VHRDRTRVENEVKNGDVLFGESRWMALLKTYKIARNGARSFECNKDAKKTCEMGDYSVHEFFMYS